jgi:hypothetical protein
VTSALDVVEDLYGGIPVFFPVAVQVRGKATDSVRDIRTSGNSEVVKAANKFTIRRMSYPGGDMWRDRQRFVRSFQLYTGYHGNIDGVSIGLVEPFEDTVDKGRLGNGDRMVDKVTSDGDTKSEFGRA